MAYTRLVDIRPFLPPHYSTKRDKAGKKQGVQEKNQGSGMSKNKNKNKNASQSASLINFTGLKLSMALDFRN